MLVLQRQVCAVCSPIRQHRRTPVIADPGRGAERDDAVHIRTHGAG